MINFLKNVFTLDNPYIYYSVRSDKLVEVYPEDKNAVDELLYTEDGREAFHCYVSLGRLRD